MNAQFEHDKAAKQPPAEDRTGSKKFYHRGHLGFAEPDIHIKRRRHGAGHGIADFVEQNESQNPKGVGPLKIFHKRFGHRFPQGARSALRRGGFWGQHGGDYPGQQATSQDGINQSKGNQLGQEQTTAHG